MEDVKHAWMLIAECQQLGVSVMRDGDTICLRGDAQAVKTAAAMLRPFKGELLRHMSSLGAGDAQAWGTYTPYCCGVMPSAVVELHELIAKYARLYRLSHEATARIIDAAKRQSLASVPEAIRLFKRGLDNKFR